MRPGRRVSRSRTSPNRPPAGLTLLRCVYVCAIKITFIVAAVPSAGSGHGAAGGPWSTHFQIDDCYRLRSLLSSVFVARRRVRRPSTQQANSNIAMLARCSQFFLQYLIHLLAVFDTPSVYIFAYDRGRIAANGVCPLSEVHLLAPSLCACCTPSSGRPCLPGIPEYCSALAAPSRCSSMRPLGQRCCGGCACGGRSARGRRSHGCCTWWARSSPRGAQLA